MPEALHREFLLICLDLNFNSSLKIEYPCAPYNTSAKSESESRGWFACLCAAFNTTHCDEVKFCSQAHEKHEIKSSQKLRNTTDMSELHNVQKEERVS